MTAALLAAILLAPSASARVWSDYPTNFRCRAAKIADCNDERCTAQSSILEAELDFAARKVRFVANDEILTIGNFIGARFGDAISFMTHDGRAWRIDNRKLREKDDAVLWDWHMVTFNTGMRPIIIFGTCRETTAPLGTMAD